MRRLFIGFEFDEDTRARIVEVQQRLGPIATRQGVRLVSPAKIHLTLLFLGHVDISDEEVSQRLVGALAGRLPMALTVAGLGGFPHLIRPKTLWLGLHGDTAALVELHRAVQSAFREVAGGDEKPYIPHLTLGRISPGSKEVGRLASLVRDELGEHPICSLDLTSLSLIESCPDGAYRSVVRWPLPTT